MREVEETHKRQLEDIKLAMDQVTADQAAAASIAAPTPGGTRGFAGGGGPSASSGARGIARS